MIYCVIPRELAGKLHEPLRRHFRDDPDIEVVVERRRCERRTADRRGGAAEAAEAEAERRRIHNPTGRRVAERRAAVVQVTPPVELPRRARPHAERLVFVERMARTAEQDEDVDTARLVTRIQGGDREGYTDLYLRYFDRVYGYVYMVLGDRHEAEDVTQHAFVRVLEGLPDYERRKQPFRAWLFVIVRNLMIDELRLRRRLDVVEPDAIDREREREAVETEHPDLSALRWITDRDLMLFIERLPVPQRQVLLLRFMLDLSTSEIGQVMGRSPENVRKLQQRALRFLEKRLISLGRVPRDNRHVPWRRRRRQAGVLRARRFALG
jgi:RNA polymerase sigma-70 factor (ECF subfamily)